ncbi:MAG: ATP-binding protein [Methanoregula sp.]
MPTANRGFKAVRAWVFMRQCMLFRAQVRSESGPGLFLAREIFGIMEIIIRETGEPGNGTRFEITAPKGMWRMNDKKE